MKDQTIIAHSVAEVIDFMQRTEDEFLEEEMSKKTEVANVTLNYRGYDITVNDQGRFVAVLDDDITVGSETFEGLKKNIDYKLRGTQTAKKRKIALPVIGFVQSKSRYEYRHSDDTIGAGVLTGYNRTSGDPEVEGLDKGFTLSNVIADTPANRAKLQRLIDLGKEHEKLREWHGKQTLSIERHGRYDEIDKYDATLKKIEAAHEKQMKEGGK